MRLLLLLAFSLAAAQLHAEGALTKLGPKLSCTSGSKVTGQEDRWSPLSVCPEAYSVTGLSRIDLQGDHNKPNLHVNDFICDDKGCKAWCIGNSCTVEARCCKLSD
jgi:hypothetical protein